MFRMLTLVAVLAAASSARAGQYNDVLSIGDKAPAWSNLPGTDGKSHSLADLANKPVVVVVFTCASCPTAVDYEERINALVKAQGGDKGQVAVVAVCVNKVKEDQLPALTQRWQEKGYAFPCLYDETQQIAKSFGAVFTPEFYVLDRDRKVVYMGAMDDATDASKVTQKYVEQSIAAALAGKKPEVTEVIARGCRVRYARERRAAAGKE